MTRIDSNERTVKKVVQGKLEGANSRGRSRTRWTETVNETVSRLKLEENWKKIAIDRQRQKGQQPLDNEWWCQRFKFPKLLK